MRAIHKIIIHCTATREGDDISVDTIRRWHLNRGWSDIGYHYVIDIKGNINAGRPIELMGAHTKGQNKYSIGIAYVGGELTCAAAEQRKIFLLRIESAFEGQTP